MQCTSVREVSSTAGNEVESIFAKVQEQKRFPKDGVNRGLLRRCQRAMDSKSAGAENVHGCRKVGEERNIDYLSTLTSPYHDNSLWEKKSFGEKSFNQARVFLFELLEGEEFLGWQAKPSSKKCR